MTRSTKRIFGLVLAGLILGFSAVYGAGSVLIAPAPSTIGPVPDNLPIEKVTFDSASGGSLSGWFISPDSNCATVILLHGVGANRLSMLGRARFLYDAGYHVFMFDFQGHGESHGDHVTFGYLEKLDVQAAIAYTKSVRPNSPVAVLGVSLGGAAAILGAPNLDVDAVIVEAVYPTIERALTNRLRLYVGGLAELIAPVFLIQLNLRLGFGPDELRPIDRIAALDAPLFLIVGTADHKTYETESHGLFAVARAPKQSWFIEGAAHEDFHRYARADYEKRVIAFLNTNIGCSPE
jgi:fermentation-respiration switch protein FrsA (DUF1100 family)